MSDEFYIGYRKTAPPKMARLVMGVASGILIAAVVVAVVIGAGQNPAGDGRYAFGAIESFEGDLIAEPVPHLELAGDAGARRAILVDQGKHGIPDYARDAMGRRVRFDATRIERHGILMLELAGPDRFEVIGDVSSPPPPNAATQITTLLGELVDTKCYLGVMNPGQGKVHRGCAAECLRGGVQPGLLVRAEDGTARVVLIDATPGAINPEWAGRTLSISGTTQQTGELETIFTDTVRLVP
jgi:hypothetical protein